MVKQIYLKMIKIMSYSTICNSSQCGFYLILGCCLSVQIQCSSLPIKKNIYDVPIFLPPFKSCLHLKQ